MKLELDYYQSVNWIGLYKKYFASNEVIQYLMHWENVIIYYCFINAISNALLFKVMTESMFTNFKIFDQYYNLSLLGEIED